MASVLYQRKKSNHFSGKAKRCLVTSGSSGGLQSWFDVCFWIPVLNLMKRMDKDWVLRCYPKRRMMLRPQRETSRNHVQNTQKEVISYTAGICEILWRRLLWIETVCTGWRGNENYLEDSSIEDCWTDNWIRLSITCEQKIEARRTYRRNITYTCPVLSIPWISICSCCCWRKCYRAVGILGLHRCGFTSPPVHFQSVLFLSACALRPI